MFLSIVCVLLSTSPGREGELDKPTLLGLLEAAYAPIQDLSCEYEGKMTYPQGAVPKITDPSGLYDDFSGVFRERRDGAILVDIYHRYYPNNGAITRETLAMLGERCENYTRMVDQRGGFGHVLSHHFSRPQIMGSVAKIICGNLLIGVLRHDGWKINQEGPQVIDGHQCVVVSFVRKDAPTMVYRFWIDLERGGHALKVDFLVGGAVDQSAFAVQLDRFEDAHGQRVWVPVSGTWEAYGSADRSGNISYGPNPTNREVYTILPESVRLNSGLEDDRFSVKYRHGTPITDTLRRVQVEFGKTASPGQSVRTHADAEAVLNEQIRLAESQGEELKASSWERSGPGWMIWLPWIGTSCSIVLLVCVLIRRRAAS